MASLRLIGGGPRRAFVMLAIAALATTARAEKPQVLVQFEVDVPAFKRSLPERTIAEQNVRDALSAEFARRYLFATWPTQAPGHSDAQLGRLMLRLEQDQNTRPNPRVYVRWLGASAADDAKLIDLGMEPIEIYSPGNPNWDTNDRRGFETRLLGKTMDQVGTDAFAQVFFKQFLARLPIAASVEPRATEHVIEIPVRWNEVLLSSDSKLVVRFSKLVDQVKQQGSLNLSHIEARAAAGDPDATEFPARLRGAITEAEFDGRPLALEQNWNDRVPEILSDAKAYCYISVYSPRDELAPDADELSPP